MNRQIVTEIKAYLDLVHRPVYQRPGWFTEDDINYIENFGFRVTTNSFYDGKILRTCGNLLWTHSCKAQCFHNIGFYQDFDSILSDYQLNFSVVEKDRGWSIDPVYEELHRDDLPFEEWLISDDGEKEIINQISNQPELPTEVVELFREVKEFVTKNYTDLRLRLVYQP